MTHTKLEAALAYASWGWPVLPLVVNGKTPASAHGVHDATTDLDLIRKIWTKNPNFNIGIAAGSKSGIIVFDVDPRNGGVDSWMDWVEEHGGDCLSECQMQITGGGGQHYIAFYQEGIRSGKPADGIDLLSDGKYFVAYPSVVNDNPYFWELSSDPFDGVPPFVVPDNWREAIGVKKTAQTTEQTSPGGSIIQGGRNDALTSLAGTMRRSGFSEPEILAALQVANEMRCEPPLPAHEVASIARSACRYDPEYDAAGDAALGGMAADALLEKLDKKRSGGFFLSRASSLISQPSPIPWIIRKWLPAGANGMIFGPSGIGKSFVAIDMACSIVTGRDWADMKINKPGVVVYLAGEGNFGMRQRMASWCLKNNMPAESIDNLLVSNMPIDLDQQGVDMDILRHIKEITDQPVSVIFIDTLNRHMAGDENSAQDVRVLNNVCSMLTAATGASTVIIHHTGKDLNAQNKERGSSSIRASLDVSILVSKDKVDGIKISVVKMKDAKEPEAKSAALESVDLGWVDEDGNNDPGAVVVYSTHHDDEIKIDIPKKLLNDRKTMEDAWFASGCDTVDQVPYISRSALKEFLRAQGLSETTIKSKLKRGRDDGLIFGLIDSGFISESLNGWVISDAETVNFLMILKKI